MNDRTAALTIVFRMSSPSIISFKDDFPQLVLPILAVSFGTGNGFVSLIPCPSTIV